MDRKTYDNLLAVIQLREMEILIKKSGFRTKKKIIITTLVDDKKYPRSALEFISNKRWQIEVALRSIKQTMKMDMLRGQSPEMINLEIWTHLLAYNLIRKIMAQSALAHGKKPRDLSFKLAMQTIREFLKQKFLDSEGQYFHKLLAIIASKTVGNRPGRSEPRLVKKRRNKDDKLKKPRSQYRQHAKKSFALS